jgi:hypothetical protein
VRSIPQNRQTAFRQAKTRCCFDREGRGMNVTQPIFADRIEATIPAVS